ncbi:MAG: hypothetical protein ACPG4X_16530 [Pikeienuella sp.]
MGDIYGKDGFVRYVPDGRVLSDFFWSQRPVDIIQGPVGSGTSSACCHRIWRHSMEQAADSRGERRSRWYIVRNTFDQLKQTTIKTWKDWFENVVEGKYGQVKMTNPPEHTIRTTLEDGTTVILEVIFLSLDDEDDVKKLLSSEPTGVWFNEAQFTDKVIFDAAHGRAMQGRFPPKRDGGPTWKGVICDLNAPPEGHWIPYMRGDVPLPEEWTEDERVGYIRPKDWGFLVQPAGLIEIIKDRRIEKYVENTRANRIKHECRDVDAVAENMNWIDETYENLIKGKDKRYIDTYVMNRVGFYREGQPVYQGFHEDTHVARDPIARNPHLPLLVGLDFARYPAMVVCQVVRGQLIVLDEYGVENEAATTYAPLFKNRILKMFPDAFSPDGPGISFFGDPTGGSMGQGTDNTPFAIFRTHGMIVYPAPGNNSVELRISSVQGQLNKMVDGRPGLLVNKGCLTIKNGFEGGYHFARVRGTSGFHDKPNKRARPADYHDALQYASLGAGFGTEVLTGKRGGTKPTKARKRKVSLRRR